MKFENIINCGALIFLVAVLSMSIYIFFRNRDRKFWAIDSVLKMLWEITNIQHLIQVLKPTKGTAEELEIKERLRESLSGNLFSVRGKDYRRIPEEGSFSSVFKECGYEYFNDGSQAWIKDVCDLFRNFILPNSTIDIEHFIEEFSCIMKCCPEEILKLEEERRKSLMLLDTIRD